MSRNSPTNKKAKSRPWWYGTTLTEDEFRAVRYATRIWLLQERVPLTFVEARIYLHDEKPETLDYIAERFGLDKDDLPSMEETVKEKVRKAEEQRDIFFGHGPIYPDDVL